MSLTLPTSKIPAVSENPRYLILYGLPKAGKTSCLAQLDNNLIIDLEGGSVFVDAMAIQCRTINDLGEAVSAIRAKNKEVGHNFYKHITIDNATRLEDICMSYACTLCENGAIDRNIYRKFRELLKPLSHLYRYSNIGYNRKENQQHLL